MFPTLQDIIDNKETSNRDKISAIQEQNKLVGLYKQNNEQKRDTSRKINLIYNGEEIILK